MDIQSHPNHEKKFNFERFLEIVNFELKLVPKRQGYMTLVLRQYGLERLASGNQMEC